MEVLRWHQDRNVAWIERQLFVTYDAEQRRGLLKLLLRELDGLAQDAEHCRLLAQLVQQTRARLDRQREIVAEHARNGDDTALPKFLLVTVLTTLALYVHRYGMLSRG